MGLFSFGASKSKSSSSGQSSSIDFSNAMSESGGFSNAGSESFSTGRAGSESGSVSTGGSRSSEGLAFEDVFARLFGGAEGAAGGLDTSMLTDTANQLFSGGIDFMSSLGGGEDTAFLEGRLRGDDGLLDEQISGLGEDIGSFFREEVLPGITSEAIAGGSLGGARQGLAEGAAADSAGREFQRGATSLRSADARDRTEAAGILGQSRIAGATAGLEGLSSLADIADFGFSADLAPFERLAAILGGPTVLGESSSFTDASSQAGSFSDTDAGSTSSATSEDFARSLSSSFGASQASNRSSGSSSGVNFDSRLL